MRINTNKPRLPVNTTPVRPRDTQSNYISGQGLTPTRQHQNGMHMANLSPNKLNATKKPMPQKGYQGQPLQQQYQTQPQQMPNIQIHQRRQSQQATRPLAMLSKRTINYCQTHPNREGVFRIESDGEYVYCCNECSHKIANSGFALERVEPGGQYHVAGVNTILSSRRQSNTLNAPLLAYQSNPPPSHKNIFPIQQSDSTIQNFTLQIDPTYRQDPRFLELQDFVEDCKAVYSSFNQNIEGFTKIQDHYVDQQRLLEEFYDATIEYMKHIKDEHISIIRTQGKRYVQTAQIESGQLEQNKEVIEDILKDISDCVDEIVMNVDQESFNACMSEYKQKVELYKHRVDEQRQTFEQMSKLEHEELEVKLQEFRTAVNEMFGVEETYPKRTVKKEPVREVSAPRKVNGNGMIRNGGGNLGNNVGNNTGNNIGNNFNNTYGNNYTHTNNNHGLLHNNPRGGYDGNAGNNRGFGGFNNEPKGIQTGVLGGFRGNDNGTTIPKVSQNGPFRTLFGDDGTAQSPQFKEI